MIYSAIRVKFGLVELQEACDAVEWALDDEVAAAKERKIE